MFLSKAFAKSLISLYFNILKLQRLLKHSASSVSVFILEKIPAHFNHNYIPQQK